MKRKEPSGGKASARTPGKASGSKASSVAKPNKPAAAKTKTKGKHPVAGVKPQSGGKAQAAAAGSGTSRAGTKSAAPTAGQKRKLPAGARVRVVTRKPASGASLPRELLEGDLPPPPPPISGPGRRYALGPSAPTHLPDVVEELGELPEAYGTRRVFVTARDPHWLYAHWDFTSDQLRACNAQAAERHLALRIYAGGVQDRPCTEVQVHPESRNWFVYVGMGGTRYQAELGYYRKLDRVWESVGWSGFTLTPPDTLAPEAEVEFATIPVEVPFETLVAMVRAAAKENVPLAEAILQLRAAGHPVVPEVELESESPWTPAREQALAEAVGHCVSMDTVRRVWVGSLEITELLRRQLVGQVSSLALAEAGGAAAGGVIPPGVGSVSSPFGEAGVRKGFWFNVNAELIVYGATEPDARVTLAGKPVRLRPDGTFSFRFALPDGQYALPAVAVSADGSDGRTAALSFSRSTVYTGEVGVHPQDPGLRRPDATHEG